jgi:multidrug efflux pump subunit AcrA (membrane-fusion protein)
MKTRLAAIALILVGVGAVALAIVGPSFAGSPSSKYITSTVTVGAVSAQSVATGTIAASTVYGFKFGVMPDIVSTSATTSGAGGSTGGGNSASAGSVTWPVKSVSVTVGQSVKKGDVLAAADDSAAQLQLASSQATLASAKSKLASDTAGPTALTKAQATNQLNQAKNSYSQAVANRKITNQQNALTLSQAKKAVTDAQAKLAGDPGNQAYIDALAQAQSNLSTTQLKVNQSNQQAAQQVSSASLNLSSARLQYSGQLAPTASATIMADQAQVASAQAVVDAAQLAVTDATILAPADGLIVAVNILAGVNAPSGYAIEESISPMVATASFTETDITGLKVGQSASVSVTAAKVVVQGTLSQIVPAASASSSTGGNQSSVVTYSVTVTLTDPPATVFSGMTATVTVTTASVASVPATALTGSASAGYSVVVMASDGSITSRSVEVGLVTTSMAQITNGVSEGETVVVGTTSTRNSTTTTGGVNLGGLTGGGLPGGGFGR